MVAGVGAGLEPDRKHIVRVGSAGQPRDDDRAGHALFDTETKRIEFERIEYAVETAAEKVLRMKLERDFARRLYTGAGTRPVAGTPTRKARRGPRAAGGPRC